MVGFLRLSRGTLVGGCPEVLDAIFGGAILSNDGEDEPLMPNDRPRDFRHHFRRTKSRVRSSAHSSGPLLRIVRLITIHHVDHYIYHVDRFIHHVDRYIHHVEPITREIF